MLQHNKIIIAISGATGIEYAFKMLTVLKSYHIETHLIVSKPAEMTREYETSYRSQDIKSLATYVYSNADIGAPLASGSYRTDGMLIIPASTKILAEVANGMGDSLITRAADVVLKERRKLILCLRETPFNLIHIENMKKATLAGAIIMPPVPAFYNHPQTLDDIISDFVYRTLDVFGLKLPEMKQWQG
ncbi:UbiX family flavin prenyltransferase [Fastidiosibacter lacustris]|uniref:UbiX family flavin prenyltransferase n=1 Tax=Fastidiosibacter lacustris TaxID=2056695 RepID=UPI000E351E28|nr:UbiX family flavin prenyltransferase [Fastidiosibacter lacustris]